MIAITELRERKKLWEILKRERNRIEWPNIIQSKVHNINAHCQWFQLRTRTHTQTHILCVKMNKNLCATWNGYIMITKEMRNIAWIFGIFTI